MSVAVNLCESYEDFPDLYHVPGNNFQLRIKCSKETKQGLTWIMWYPMAWIGSTASWSKSTRTGWGTVPVI